MMDLTFRRLLLPAGPSVGMPVLLAHSRRLLHALFPAFLELTLSHRRGFVATAPARSSSASAVKSSRNYDPQQYAT